MKTEIRHSRFEAIVDVESEFEQLGTGFDFTEGPIWHPVEKHLTFSDMPGNIMRRWQNGTIETFRQPSNMANGNAYDRKGRMVTCEHATSRVIRTNLDGTIEVLASHYEGKELNSPNDVIVKSDGAIYFSDPDFGRLEYYGLLREKELDFQGVYRIDPGDNSLRLLIDDFGEPNGLCFSPDESLLYINDTANGHIRVFEVTVDGGIANDRLFAEVTGDGDGAADGLKSDTEGNVYCTGPGGIHVFDTDGNALGVVLLPEPAANFGFGGQDFCDVFVTASTSLYRFRVKVPGPTPF